MLTLSHCRATVYDLQELIRLLIVKTREELGDVIDQRYIDAFQLRFYSGNSWGIHY